MTIFVLCWCQYWLIRWKHKYHNQKQKL